jgi:exonuclease III
MLRIISYNIRGITTCKKQQLFKIWLNQNPHDIVMLQETHMTKIFHLENFKKSFLEYNITGALGTWFAGGVLIMIKKKFNIIDYGSDTNGSICYIKIECNHVPIVLVNVYAPAQITERCSFFKELILYVPSTKWIIIGGDFNCTPNNQQDRNKLGLQTDNRSYPILVQEVINPLLLTEIFRRKQPRKIIYSYHASAGNYHSRLDLVFGSDIIYKNTHEIGYVPVGLSDHDALILSIKIPPFNDKNIYRRWICNPNIIKRKSFLEKFHRVWNIIIKTADFNTTIWWKDFKTSLIMILQQEEKDLNQETRRELDELSKEYRFRATNPSNDDFAQLEIIRKKLHDALTKKFINAIPSQDAQVERYGLRIRQ